MLLPKDRGFVHPLPSEITAHAEFKARRLLLAGLRRERAALGARRKLRASGRAEGRRADGCAKHGAGCGDDGEAKRHSPTSPATNNYYEFGTDKSDPARAAPHAEDAALDGGGGGEVRKPGTFGIDELLKLGAMEERIYRLRCVEGWSMVIPWAAIRCRS